MKRKESYKNAFVVYVGVQFCAKHHHIQQNHRSGNDYQFNIVHRICAPWLLQQKLLNASPNKYHVNCNHYQPYPPLAHSLHFVKLNRSFSHYSCLCSLIFVLGSSTDIVFPYSIPVEPIRQHKALRANCLPWRLFYRYPYR